MGAVDAHFINSAKGPGWECRGRLLFTTPTLVTSDELLEGYTPEYPDAAKLRSSWHNLIDLCQHEDSRIYLRLVLPEITHTGERRIREHLKKFRRLYKHFSKFSGVEIDLTNGFLHSVCQNGSVPLKRQEDYLQSVLSSITETTNLGISIRLSFLRHIHLLTSSRVLFSKCVSLVHLVDINPSFLNHTAMLSLLSYYDGSDPPIRPSDRSSFDGDVLLYRIEVLRKISGHTDLGTEAFLKPPLTTMPVLAKNDVLPNVLNVAAATSVDYNGLMMRRSPILRAPSPMKRRKTGFQDELEPFSPELSEMRPASSVVQLWAWGWTILIIVWSVFLIGIGSFFGVFQSVPKVQNYAQYEKETGYPIPVYYPTLIFLCIVVAWVWCIVSWMGMKFFRHAKGGINNN
ncbi:hypothetical protein TRVA0_009S02828 [Trichomonascus vanleenenianus]|uniref:PIG-Y family protein n=1 Tax=Trichomonascus vanleenenianus TaxID=2268995 RepID=UPI003ECB9E3A